MNRLTIARMLVVTGLVVDALLDGGIKALLCALVIHPLVGAVIGLYALIGLIYEIVQTLVSPEPPGKPPQRSYPDD